MGNKVFAEKKENVVAGIVGAFLFSLAGAAVYVLLDLVGFIAGISGLVGVVCAMQGYKIFGGKLSKKGVIIAAVIALLVIILAWYGCLAKDYYQACKEWYEAGTIQYMPTYFQCFASSFLLLQQREIATSYIITLLLGVAFAVFGGFRYVVNAFAQAKAEQKTSSQTVVTDTTPFTGEPSVNEIGSGDTVGEIKDEGTSFIEQEIAVEQKREAEPLSDRNEQKTQE